MYLSIHKYLEILYLIDIAYTCKAMIDQSNKEVDRGRNSV